MAANGLFSAAEEQQAADPANQRHEPQGYYHRTGPLGRIFEVFKTTSPLPSGRVRPAGEGSEGKPGLYVAHVMLPHVPYQYLPAGQMYEFPLAVSQQRRRASWNRKNARGSTPLRSHRHQRRMYSRMRTASAPCS